MPSALKENELDDVLTQSTASSDVKLKDVSLDWSLNNSTQPSEPTTKHLHQRRGASSIVGIEPMLSVVPEENAITPTSSVSSSKDNYAIYCSTETIPKYSDERVYNIIIEAFAVKTNAFNFTCISLDSEDYKLCGEDVSIPYVQTHTYADPSYIVTYIFHNKKTNRFKIAFLHNKQQADLINENINVYRLEICKVIINGVVGLFIHKFEQILHLKEIPENDLINNKDISYTDNIVDEAGNTYESLSGIEIVGQPEGGRAGFCLLIIKDKDSEISQDTVMQPNSVFNSDQPDSLSDIVLTMSDDDDKHNDQATSNGAFLNHEKGVLILLLVDINNKMHLRNPRNPGLVIESVVSDIALSLTIHSNPNLKEFGEKIREKCYNNKKPKQANKGRRNRPASAPAQGRGRQASTNFCHSALTKSKDASAIPASTDLTISINKIGTLSFLTNYVYLHNEAMYKQVSQEEWKADAEQSSLLLQLARVPSLSRKQSPPPLPGRRYSSSSSQGQLSRRSSTESRSYNNETDPRGFQHENFSHFGVRRAGNDVRRYGGAVDQKKLCMPHSLSSGNIQNYSDLEVGRAVRGYGGAVDQKELRMQHSLSSDNMQNYASDSWSQGYYSRPGAKYRRSSCISDGSDERGAKENTLDDLVQYAVAAVIHSPLTSDSEQEDTRLCKGKRKIGPKVDLGSSSRGAPSSRVKEPSTYARHHKRSRSDFGGHDSHFVSTQSKISSSFSSEGISGLVEGAPEHAEHQRSMSYDNHDS